MGRNFDRFHDSFQVGQRLSCTGSLRCTTEARMELQDACEVISVRLSQITIMPLSRFPMLLS
jgi:hypothetical protein